jgi:hypothetical protein
LAALDIVKGQVVDEAHRRHYRSEFLRSILTNALTILGISRLR